MVALFWSGYDCNEIHDIVTALGNMDGRFVHSQNLAPAVFTKSVAAIMAGKVFKKILRQFSAWMAEESRGTVLWLTAGHPCFFPDPLSLPEPHRGSVSVWETHEVVSLPKKVVYVVVLHMPCFSSDEEVDAIDLAGRCTNAESTARLFAIEKLPQHLKFICCTIPP